MGARRSSIRDLDIQKSAMLHHGSDAGNTSTTAPQPNSPRTFLIFETGFQNKGGGQMVLRNCSQVILKAGRSRLARKELGKQFISASLYSTIVRRGGFGQITIAARWRHVWTLLFLLKNTMSCATQNVMGAIAGAPWLGGRECQLRSVSAHVSPRCLASGTTGNQVP